MRPKIKDLKILKEKLVQKNDITIEGSEIL